MLDPIQDIIQDLRQGKMIVLTDDENRENEGDLVLPAQFISPQAITFMLSTARGYMCLSLSEADCNRLDLHPQSAINTSVRGTPMTVSIDGHPKHGFTTGVSALERANSILLAINPASSPEDFVRPGHINPLRSRDGGVLVRTGQTEGSLDLCRLAGLTPAAVIIEIMRDDGEMARVPDLERFCAQHKLKMCSVAQIIEHRLARESLVHRLEPVRGTQIDTPQGPFNLIAFKSLVDALPHVALTVGGVGDLDPSGAVIENDAPTLIRMHRRNLLGDVFAHSPDGATSSSNLLHAAMEAIQNEGRGAIVYLRPEGSDTGTGLEQQLQTISRHTHNSGADTPDLTHPEGLSQNAMPLNQRAFGIGGQIIRQLGLSKIRILSNHPRTMPGIDSFGIDVVGTEPIDSV